MRACDSMVIISDVMEDILGRIMHLKDFSCDDRMMSISSVLFFPALARPTFRFEEEMDLFNRKPEQRDYRGEDV